MKLLTGNACGKRMLSSALMVGALIFLQAVLASNARAQTNIPYCVAEIDTWDYSINNKLLTIVARVRVEGEEALPRRIYVKFGGQGIRYSGQFQVPAMIDAIGTGMVRTNTSFVQVRMQNYDIDEVLSLEPLSADCYANPAF
ncbi:hypothetical protein [Microvirga lotononidis]|uniref:Uncharacterized protein n=1 Tax=Microvirga lotononidis TaxID=864069 RepID=I4YS79_9HYPH|nr:hypothetical protein [Microvirga lotononidis]EIM26821.1 hypothetical protein MicloDRAFT_00033710 [Microvirga lotononidis]WQO31380.1 hypothetical protein U0023_34410 [Microvirga lotononidis]